jgi:two-component system, chemotaxis family, sensor kinase CheA
MDVVRSNLKKVNGSVELQSRVGQGTTVLLHLPLTLTILPVLLVQVGSEIYALPLRSIVETTRLSSAKVHLVDGREVAVCETRRFPSYACGLCAPVLPTRRPQKKKSW